MCAQFLLISILSVNNDVFWWEWYETSNIPYATLFELFAFLFLLSFIRFILYFYRKNSKTSLKVQKWKKAPQTPLAYRLHIELSLSLSLSLSQSFSSSCINSLIDVLICACSQEYVRAVNFKLGPRTWNAVSIFIILNAMRCGIVVNYKHFSLFYNVSLLFGLIISIHFYSVKVLIR